MAEQNEGRQDRHRFVEDVAATHHTDDERIGPAGSNRDRDQHHHVEGPSPERATGSREEDGGRIEDDGQAEHELEKVVAKAEGCGHGEVQHVSTDARPEQDGHRQDRRHQEPVAHVADHAVHRHAGVAAVPHDLLRRAQGGLVRLLRGGAVRLDHRIAEVIGHRLPRTVVATLLDPAPQVVQGGGRGIVCHGGRLGDGVCLHAVDAWPARKHGLYDGLFSCVVKSRDLKDHGRRPGNVRRDAHAERVASTKASGLRSNAFAHPGLQK